MPSYKMGKVSQGNIVNRQLWHGYKGYDMPQTRKFIELYSLTPDSRREGRLGTSTGYFGMLYNDAAAVVAILSSGCMHGQQAYGDESSLE